MEIKIESVTIEKDQIEAVIKLEASVREIASQGRYENATSAIKERVVEALVEKFLQENSIAILKSVDLQAVINAVTLRAAQRASDNIR